MVHRCEKKTFTAVFAPFSGLWRAVGDTPVPARFHVAGTGLADNRPAFLPYSNFTHAQCHCYFRVLLLPPQINARPTIQDRLHRCLYDAFRLPGFSRGYLWLDNSRHVPKVHKHVQSAYTRAPTSGAAL
ncbi:hypothetical protein J1614_009589 [Plenodomus biglobosus]|nr:hypothetical protein J1614_009589 [Plenodomus biglobosus]